MKKDQSRNLQFLVFFLVMASMANVYIVQPVLPILEREFGTTAPMASLAIAATILGIALANLPFGMLADRYAVKPLILIGGFAVSLFGFFCAVTASMGLLVLARFIQGLFIPAVTTCLAAYLARSLPVERLNVIMGSSCFPC